MARKLCWTCKLKLYYVCATVEEITTPPKFEMFHVRLYLPFYSLTLVSAYIDDKRRQFDVWKLKNTQANLIIPIFTSNCLFIPTYTKLFSLDNYVICKRNGMEVNIRLMYCLRIHELKNASQRNEISKDIFIYIHYFKFTFFT